MKRKSVYDRGISGYDRRTGGDRPIAGDNPNRPVTSFLYLPDDCSWVKDSTSVFDDGRQTPQIFQRVQSSLARITQYLLFFAMAEGNTNQPVNGRADLADRVQFIFDVF